MQEELRGPAPGSFDRTTAACARVKEERLLFREHAQISRRGFMPTMYALKSRFQAFPRPLTAQLAHSGITAS